MNTFNNWVIEFFQWVLQTSWQAAVLAGLILLAQWLFRKRLSPAWRYGLWLLLVIRLLMPVSPQSGFSVFNVAKLAPRTPQVDQTPRESAAPPTVLLTPAGSPAIEAPVSETPSDQPVVLFAREFEQAPPGNTSSVIPPAAAPNPHVNWFKAAFGFWLAGAALFGLRLAWSSLWFHSRIRAHLPLCDRRAL